MDIKEAIEIGNHKLREKKIEFPLLKTRLLLAFLLEKPKEYLISHEEEKLEKSREEEFLIGLQKLINHTPIEYIIHKKEFRKFSFYVDENVLIPRQDTEILVEEIEKIAKDMKNPKILEIGTGSGAIAISLAKELGVEVLASDISKAALKVAKKNAEFYQVNIPFIISNIFENIKGKFTIIVSNPPYIETTIVKQLDEQVKKEPILALDGGKDGLQYDKILINEAPDYLLKDGYLCLEIGYNQKQAIEELIQKTKKYKEVQCIKDLTGNDRVIIAKKG